MMKNNKNKINKDNVKSKKGFSESQIEKMVDNAVEKIDELNNEINDNDDSTDDVGKGIEIKTSKPISDLKKGDKIKIDGKELEVDAHYVLVDHGNTKEMAIEIFGKDDKDYQIRYFDDQAESTLELYELEEIMYVKKTFKKVEW